MTPTIMPLVFIHKFSIESILRSFLIAKEEPKLTCKATPTLSSLDLELDFELNFRVGFLSWISSWIFGLGSVKYRLQTSGWSKVFGILYSYSVVQEQILIHIS